MFDFWVQGERFYTFILPIAAIVFLILSGCLLFVFFYTAKKSRDRRLLSNLFSLVLIGISGYAVWQHMEYNHWLDQAALVNPGIRNQSKILGTVSMEDPALVEEFKSINLRNRLSALDMYSEEEVTQRIGNRYLGSREQNHYFAIGEEGKYAFRYTGDIEYTEENSYMTGSTFTLNEPRFKELGFIFQSSNYLNTIYINKEEAEQAGTEFPRNVVPISEAYINWVFKDPV